jgi:carbonic anhydrase
MPNNSQYGPAAGVSGLWRWCSRACVCALAIAAAGSALAAPHGTHWTYEGAEGPKSWGSLSGDYATCASGKAQSPINITGASEGSLPGIQLDYEKIPLKILNNGHTVQVDYGMNGRAALPSGATRIAQFHFHAPSEHQINGKSFPMEVHFVHKDPAGKLAVIGVMFVAGKANPALEAMWAKMPTGKDQEIQAKEVVVSASDLMPKDRSFYHYKGSLTTPPCSEGVSWYVMKKPIEASRDQISRFQKLFGHNERPVQALNGRELVLVADDGKRGAVPDVALPTTPVSLVMARRVAAVAARVRMGKPELLAHMQTRVRVPVTWRASQLHQPSMRALVAQKAVRGEWEPSRLPQDWASLVFWSLDLS